MENASYYLSSCRSPISSNESFSSRRSSMLSNEQPEQNRQRNLTLFQQVGGDRAVYQNIACQSYKTQENQGNSSAQKFDFQTLSPNGEDVDWEDVTRKLSMPLSQDVSQQYNFQNKIMHKSSMNRYYDGYALRQNFPHRGDELSYLGVDHAAGGFFDDAGAASANQTCRDAFAVNKRLQARRSSPRNLERYNLQWTDVQFHQDLSEDLRRTVRPIARHFHQDLSEDLARRIKCYKNRKMGKPRQICKPQKRENTFAEGDYLLSEDLSKKPKYRLLISPTMKLELEKEFPLHANNLEAMIIMTFLSLGISVKVTKYTRLNKHRTSDKTFSVTFESVRDASAALQLIKQRWLDFRMTEARPSPRYHVKFIVLRLVGVYEGRAFNRRVRYLQKGDIVTANQERRNKIRIIRCCAHGTEIEHELKGWVLMQTKEKELLRRIWLVDGEVVMKERCSFKKKRTCEQSTVSPKSPKSMPFRCLDHVNVYDGRVESSSSVIGQLLPGAVVYGDQLRGSMLRIIKTDVCSNVQLKQNGQPQPYGWVMLRRKVDDKPQFEFFPSTRKFQREPARPGELNLIRENPAECLDLGKWGNNCFGMAEEFSKRYLANGSLSYNDVMSMGSPRSETHSPITTSSTEWMTALEKQTEQLEELRMSSSVESLLDQQWSSTGFVR